MLNKIDTTKILIPLNNNIYLNYSNIICLLDPKDIINTKWFKTKKIVKTKDDLEEPKSYIYCKNDFIVATSIEINSLNKRIDEITFNYYNNDLFR